MKILELQKRSDRDANMDKMHELYDKRQKKQEELEVVRGSHQSSQSHLENQDQQFSSSHQELSKLHQLLITLQSKNEELNRKLMDKTSTIEEGLTVLENYPLSAHQDRQISNIKKRYLDRKPEIDKLNRINLDNYEVLSHDSAEENIEKPSEFDQLTSSQRIIDDHQQ